MKKLFQRCCFCLLMLLLIAFLVACGEGNKSYRVQFEIRENVVSETDVKHGTCVNLLDIKNGEHDFVCWHKNTLDGEIYIIGTPVTEDLYLVAEWTSTVTLVNEDGSELEVLEVKKGESFEPSELPTKKSDTSYDYAFKEWDHELIGTGEDLTIKAVFEKTAIVRKVTFYDEHDEKIQTVEVANGSSFQTGFNYTVEADNYYTYEYVGWETDKGDLFDFSSAITSDLDLYVKTKRTPKPIDFKGKIYSMLGDSVSTFYAEGDPLCSYYGGQNQFYYPYLCPRISKGEQTYWGQLINRLGLKLGVNESYSGTRCTGDGNTAACSDFRIGHLDDNGTPDIISVFIGINDNVGGVSVTTFKAGYEKILSKINKLYPNAYVFCVMHPYNKLHIVNTNPSFAKYSDTTRQNYNTAMRDLAEKYQYAIVNLEEVQTPENCVSLGNDNLHPNQEGHDAWYSQFYKDFVNYFSQSTETYPIEYVVEEGANVPQDAVKEYHVGSVFDLPTPVKEGYTFGGWYLESDFNGNAITDTSILPANVTLYAEFNQTPPKGKMYVRFIYNGGLKEGCTIETNVNYVIVPSVTYTLPTNVIKEGYKFEGWYDNPEFSGSKLFTVKTSLKVFAKWSKVD